MSSVQRSFAAREDLWSESHYLNGGYLVLGVAERGGRAELPPVGLDPKDLDRAQRWIRGHCRRLDPECQPVLAPQLVDGRHVLVVWAPGSESRPHLAPESLAKGAPRRFWVRLGSETVKAQGALLVALHEQAAKVPFDDRRALGVPVERLQGKLVREVLAEIGSRLGEEPDDREIYRRMRLTVKVNGHEVPRHVALLFFSHDPEEWLRGARIEVAELAGGAAGNVIAEHTFRGPLHHQVRSCLAHLRGTITRHVVKVEEAAEVSTGSSYPLPALEEAVVNAVYYRGYDGVAEPVKVHVHPDRIEVISYPGPVPGLELSHFDPGARLPPVPARNRRIGELLKELRLAEGRFTGWPKIRQAMAANGSPPPRVEFDAGRSYFCVVLPVHPRSLVVATLRDVAELEALGDHASALARLEAALAAAPGAGLLAAKLIEVHARRGALAAARAVGEHFAGCAGREREDAVTAALGRLRG